MQACFARFSLLLLVPLVGCHSAQDENIHFDDARNPLVKQAQADLDANNPEAAANDEQQALAADPKLVDIYYRLGMLEGEKLNDPLSSIYHLKRFLALSPASDKADEVKAMIDKQGIIFGATLPAAPLPPSDEQTKLQDENAKLKQQLAAANAATAKAQSQLAAYIKRHHLGNLNGSALAASTPPAPTSPAGANGVEPGAAVPAITAPGTLATPPAIGASAGNAAPAAAPRAQAVDLATAAQGSADAGEPPAPVPSRPARSYKIAAGDSLWRISHKMYPGDTKNGIERIKDANKEILVDGKPLKIGQVLVIP